MLPVVKAQFALVLIFHACEELYLSYFYDKAPRFSSRCVLMKKKSYVTALVLITLVLLGTLSLSVTVTAKANSSGVYALILPATPPSDAGIANATVDLLITLNKLASSGKGEFYWLLTSAKVGNDELPSGAIVLKDLSEDALQAIKDLVSKCRGSVKLVEIASLPHASAVVIKPPKIALFDNGALSEISLPDVLKAMGFQYTVVSNSSIEDLLKGKYDLLILPPGSGTATARALGPGGSKVVAKFVYSGGGLIGICAGAYAAIKGYNEPTSWIQLVDATLKNWPIWYLGVGVVEVNITADTPVTYGFKGIRKFIYWNGPVLIPYDLGKDTTLGIDVQPPTPLATFVKTLGSEYFAPGSGLNITYVDKVISKGYAITYSTYGSGQIVLFSVHPELITGDLSSAPKAYLTDKYNWRMLWNAIYFVAGRRVVLGGRIVGTWMWPSLITNAYEAILREKYGTASVSMEQKLNALKEALDYLAAELKSYNITDVFLEVKLLSGTLLWPSDVGEKYGVPTLAGKDGKEPYNLTNVIKLFADTLHKYGIRLNAWIIVWYDKFWGAKDPMWHCGKWVSPSEFKLPYPMTSRVRLFNTTYQDYIAELAKELVTKCDVDGIHLDYIRWPHVVYSFGPKDYALAKEHGINLTKVERYVILTYYGMPNESIAPQPGLIFEKYYVEKDPDVVKWFELRRQAVVSILEKVKDAVESTGKKVTLSAAVMPEEGPDNITLCRTDLETGHEYCAVIPGQAWQWVHYSQHYSDFAKLGYWLIPMTYYKNWGKSPAWVGRVVKYALGVTNNVNPSDKVLAGLQAYGGVKYEDVKAEINYALNAGANGWVYFVWNEYRDLAWSTLISKYGAELESAKKILKGPVMLAASITGYATAKDEAESLLKELTAAGTDYFKPNPEVLANEVKAKTLELVKELSGKLVTELETMEPAVKKLGAPYTGYYEFVLNRANEYFSEVSESNNLTKVTEPFSNLVNEAVPAIVLLNSATSNQGALTSLQEQLKKLENEVSGIAYKDSAAISNLQSKVGNLEKLLEDLKTSIKSIAGNVSELNNRLGQTASKVKELETTSSNTHDELTALKSKVSSLEDDLTSLKSYVKGEISKVSQAGQEAMNEASSVKALATTSIALAIIALILATTTLIVARKGK